MKSHAESEDCENFPMGYFRRDRIAGEIMERDGLKAAKEGNIVGREGPRRDVKVLG